ncbi:MAG: DUF6873 family GME fold protein [Candidatus Omnitrophota bacterium]
MLIVHDKRLPQGYVDALKVKLPQVSLFPFDGAGSSAAGKVYDSILSHPDIYFFQLNDNTVVHAPSLTDEQIRPLKERGMNLIKGAGDPFGTYPDTVRYNAVRIGRTVLHDLQHTDPVIIDAARGEGLETVHVEQGYTRCSTLAVSDNAFITSDEEIASAGKALGMEVLLLFPGDVFLAGEKYGFIGGTGGRTPDGTVILLGDIRRHPQYEAAQDFLIRCACGHIFLEDMPLYDAGGLFIAGGVQKLFLYR